MSQVSEAPPRPPISQLPAFNASEPCITPPELFVSPIPSIRTLPDSLRRDFEKMMATLFRHVNTAHTPARQEECFARLLAVGELVLRRHVSHEPRNCNRRSAVYLLPAPHAARCARPTGVLSGMTPSVLLVRSQTVFLLQLSRPRSDAGERFATERSGRPHRHSHHTLTLQRLISATSRNSKPFIHSRLTPYPVPRHISSLQDTTSQRRKSAEL